VELHDQTTQLKLLNLFFRGALALISLGEAAALVTRPGPRVVERVVVVRETSATPVTASTSMDQLASVTILSRSPALPARTDAAASEPSWTISANYGRLHSLNARYGFEGLPDPPPLALQSEDLLSGSEAESGSGLLKSEFANRLNSGEPL
jgi:hypothetical protein